MSSPRTDTTGIVLLMGIVLFLPLFGGCELNAQVTEAAFVMGSVTNAETGEPLENVNVYLAYTLIGTPTSADGSFSLPVPRPGSYDIVFSLLGFRPRKEHIELHAGDSLTLDVTLAPAPIETEPMEITSTPDLEWKKSLALFTRAIIGRSDLSSGCTILNPETINFEWRGDTLMARDDHLLKIENRSLGYLVHVVIGEFTWNTARDYGHFLIYPYFKPLTPPDEEEAKRWASNRDRAYNGSIRHFFRSLIGGITAEESFVIYSGPLMKLENGQGHRVVDADFHIERYDTLPFFDVRFPGYIRVEYGERETDFPGTDDNRRRKYALVRPSAPPPRASVIRMTGTTVIVDSSGHLFDPLSIEVAGDWANRRIENLLPRD